LRILHFIAERPYIDGTRVGVWGLERRRHQDAESHVPLAGAVQKCLAVAPVPDQMLYDNTYRERYMGLPSGNPDGYRDFMEYPNRTHAISEGKGIALHIYTLIARYFEEHLLPGPEETKKTL
jgi:hypothetical protein